MRKQRYVAVLLLMAVVGAFGGRTGVAHATDPVTGDPVVVAVGDMACSPFDPHFNGGAGQNSNCGEMRVSNGIVADTSVDKLLALGDVQYGCGDPASYAASYTPSFGRLLSITAPAVGNHEYNTVTDPDTGAACPDPNNAAEDYFSYFGAAAHPETAGHYSFNMGSWHIIALNANCNLPGVGGCGATSPQTQWLAADLADNTRPCTLAYWHQPRWTAATANNSSTAPWWNLLYQHHADLVLGGHLHLYGRFAQLNPSGQPDPNGIREVIVGTGGQSLQAASASANPAPQTSQRTFGYLRLVLHPQSYDGTFINSNTGAVKDSFSAACHNPPPPPAQLTIGQSAPATVQADGSVTYAVTVSNPSTTVAQTNVSLTDTPPAAAILGTVTPSTGSCSTAATITCSLGTLAPGASDTVTVSATPILPPSAVNAASATSDQTTTPVTKSQSVTVTPAAGTSYVSVSDSGFGAPAPAMSMGSVLQWSFVGSGSHSATDSTGIGLFPDTGPVTPVAFAQMTFQAAGVYDFNDTVSGFTTKVKVPMTATPATGSVSTPFTLTWAAAPPPGGYVEDVQVIYPGTTAWVSLSKGTTATSMTFTPAKGTGKYQFRARFRNAGTNAASAFSGTATITVS